MDLKLNEDQILNSEDNIYKYQSSDLPKLTISMSESSKSTRFDSYSRKKNKRVTFNRNVTVVNIQSHKKDLRKQYKQNLHSVFDEDFNEDKNQKCANCEIF